MSMPCSGPCLSPYAWNMICAKKRRESFSRFSELLNHLGINVNKDHDCERGDDDHEHFHWYEETHDNPLFCTQSHRHAKNIVHHTTLFYCRRCSWFFHNHVDNTSYSLLWIVQSNHSAKWKKEKMIYAMLNNTYSTFSSWLNGWQWLWRDGWVDEV